MVYPPLRLQGCPPHVPEDGNRGSDPPPSARDALGGLPRRPTSYLPIPVPMSGRHQAARGAPSPPGLCHQHGQKRISPGSAKSVPRDSNGLPHHAVLPPFLQTHVLQSKDRDHPQEGSERRGGYSQGDSVNRRNDRVNHRVHPSGQTAPKRSHGDAKQGVALAGRSSYLSQKRCRTSSGGRRT